MKPAATVTSTTMVSESMDSPRNAADSRPQWPVC
jgi:hypothetical protein